MRTRLTEPDHQLIWPRSLFVEAAAELLNRRDRRDWNERCQLLLDQAFVSGYSGGPSAAFAQRSSSARSSSGFGAPPQDSGADLWTTLTTVPRPLFTPEQELLRKLMVRADELPEDDSPSRPYWRERKVGVAGISQTHLSSTAAVREFVSLMDELTDTGYFEQSFGDDCPDSESYIDANTVIKKKLGVDTLWPLDTAALANDIDLFYDAVEVLHDLVARPESRSWHGYAGCTWHYENFDPLSGRRVYVWRVNKILDRSQIELRLAESGDDAGRLVATTDDARADLVSAVVGREDGGPADQVRHALEMFRNRGADRHQKRSAIAVLALVLEERRYGVVADAMTSADRGALFAIAKSFHIRHQDAKQMRDYDDFYLDWIFWVYLATVELTNRVLDEQAARE